VNSNGLRYSWTPASTLNDATAKNPTALPGPGTTAYTVLARIGRCIETDEVRVTTVPYPTVRLGNDTTICFATGAQLNAEIVANRFVWSPVNTLSNPSILNPIARPRSNTSYVLTVFDNLGCPKPSTDTIRVTVLPEIVAFAGNDTSVVVNQPLQLNATGGVGYLWSPATSLNRNNIANPLGIYNGSFDSIMYYVTVSDDNGCTDVDSIRVKVFRTNPQIFVPSAFTPNGDGKNDYFRPIAVGIEKINYFRVYNRWGQLVFSTTTNEFGWDGKINGQPQGTNTYAWVVEGVDFTGKVVRAKGTVTLIR
jgi:gliding motility-associated-like protein